MRNKLVMIMVMVAALALAGCTGDSTIDGNTIADTDGEDAADGTITIEENPEKVQVYYFWGEGCPFCADQNEFFEGIDDEIMEHVQLLDFETYRIPENSRFYQELALAHGETARGVPMTFIGDQVWSGFNERMGNEMVEKIKECIKEGCESPSNKLE